ncbi:MAG: xanthine dehydrogenase family protein [Rhodospirillaceae bacterium]|jgi:aerobic carbon-monoxide dehydrogenase large subunit|nr:xanthine dehydrogenase family protein [Rhodospirillaceae bacterium]MBT6511338.1 xanthine dehydrogenase family protein [Rhodospirillaceae bacterium]
MKNDGIGSPLRRKEDRRLLTGRGRYSGDIANGGELAAVFRRSDLAHGMIRKVDATSARTMPGVVAVLTAADINNGKPLEIGCKFGLIDRDGNPAPDLPRPVLCGEKVRMAGDPLALVLAETEAQARDAAEAVEVEIDPLQAAGTMANALSSDVPDIWKSAPGNIAFHWQSGKPDAVDGALRRAAHTVTLDLVNNRITANPMEPRCALAIPEPGGRLRLVKGNQAPHLLRSALAGLLGMAEHDITVVSEDMGGGFGMRTSPYAEEVALSIAALETGRPVRWTATRNEAVVSDLAARAHETHAVMGLDGEGHLLGLRVDTRADLGAYLTGFGPGVGPALYAPLIPNVYNLPCLDIRIDGVMTNTSPTAPYRGAGRPEAVYLIERLMDQAAIQTGLDPFEIRRRNMITRETLPFTTVTGLTYDSGDFTAITRAALEIAGQPEKQEASDHRLRGVGFATMTETSAMHGNGVFEVAHVRFHPSGSAVVGVGTHSHGQGHETSFAQIAAEQLGLPVDKVTIVFGDTSKVPYGQGTYASRSTALAGPAILGAADKVIEKGRHLAAHLMEASADDVEFSAGQFTIAGTDRTRSWADLARVAYVAPTFAGTDLEPGLEEQAFYAPEGGTFPNACHVAEVAVDPDTGEWSLERYVAVNDVGTVINPLILEGQIHGGLAQGVGQAMMEHCVFDPETAQPLSGTFMDYAMPRADDLPLFEHIDRPDPCLNNRLGVKGAGELGTIGAPPVIINALLDALRPLGVTKLDMPATPQAVWRALQQATVN